MSIVYRRSQGIEASAMKAESLLFDPGTNKFCLLNETAALVWERLDQPATADQLASAVCERFSGVERAQADKDVHELLHRLEALALISVVN
jgi:PqqD family protein of HPr-rel-A system